MKLSDKMSAMSPREADKGVKVSNVTTNATPKAKNGAKYEATFIFRKDGDSVKTLSTESVSSSETSTETSSLTFDAVATSTDVDEDDAEIWFLIKLNDADGIPFYRELELNGELEKEGSIYRFDPSDGFGIDDPDLHQSLIEADAYGDYDGDGVPNAVELFIGKNPTLRDILGIKLTVAVGWDANQTELTQLLWGFQKASQVIYDYTDGYAMISEITIKNNVHEGSEEWNKSMVRITLRNTNPATSNGFWYWKWVKNLDRKEEGYILFPWDWYGGPLNKGWYGGMAHELGHFVFGIGDEYGVPFFWDPNNDSKLDGFTYNDLKNLLASKYGIEFEKMKTVMEAGQLWTEISTPRDYAVFKEQLENVSKELEEKTGEGLLELIKNYGGPWDLNSTEQVMPTHWQSKYWIDGVPQVHKSAWEVVFALLAKGHTLGHHYVYDIDAGLYLDLDFDGNDDTQLPASYTSKTGPYTGVGYYMIVKWG